MRLRPRIWMLVLFLRSAAGQSQPDVADILKKVSETYKAATQYEFVVEASATDPGTNKSVSAHAHMAFKPPNKYHLEGALAGMGLDPAFANARIIYDGSGAWCYLPTPNRYVFFPASTLTSDAKGDMGDLRPEAMDYFMMWRYRGAADFVTTAKILREESIEFGGTKVPCYVISVAPQEAESAYVWWVDEKQYRILREDSPGSSAVFTSIKLDGPLSEDLFTFKPPPGARKLEVPQ